MRGVPPRVQRIWRLWGAHAPSRRSRTGVSSPYGEPTPVRGCRIWSRPTSRGCRIAGPSAACSSPPPAGSGPTSTSPPWTARSSSSRHRSSRRAWTRSSVPTSSRRTCRSRIAPIGSTLVAVLGDVGVAEGPDPVVLTPSVAGPGSDVVVATDARSRTHRAPASIGAGRGGLRPTSRRGASGEGSRGWESISDRTPCRPRSVSRARSTSRRDASSGRNPLPRSATSVIHAGCSCTCGPTRPSPEASRSSRERSSWER